MVFGTGSESASAMFIGEAPGEREDALGEPFVGAAGKLLDKYLEYIDVKREDIYIANILKCRPPNNRDPFEEEQEACISYLRMQVKIIRPKLLVCLGRIAAYKIIGKDFKISRDRGIVIERNGYKIMATYHPAALLHADSKAKAMDVLDDFKLLKSLIG